MSQTDGSQHVEHLIDSINCSNNTLQTTIGLIRANTSNMRKNFEVAASSLVEVEPYKSQQRNIPNKEATMSSVSFVWWSNSGVNLRWHHPKDFKALSNDNKDELTAWQSSQEGRKILEKSKKVAAKKRRQDSSKKQTGDPYNYQGGRNMKSAIKTPHGLKIVMALLASEENSSKAFQAELTAALSAHASSAATTTQEQPM